jgi:serine/threonine protein kinase/Tol biopolymer transport system component
MTLAAGTRLGPHEILAPLGAGGMGEVYRARDTRLGRELAIKVLPSELASDAGRRARFEQEARAASALNHPHIVTVHDVGAQDDLLYVAMELVEGRSLRELIAAGPLPTRKVLEIGAQIADGLAKAHGACIVHRDLKPENVVLSRDGYAKILDFGLAKLSASPANDDAASQLETRSAHDTHPGTVLGTVGYMSPEQASGKPVDFRSDQFALGSILYEMATGRRAFKRATSAETLSAIIRDEPPPLSQANPSAPAPLRWVVERCLAKDPEDRYAATRDLARDLQSLRDHLSETTAPLAVPPVRRRAAPVVLGATLLLAGFAAAVPLLRRDAPAPPTFTRLTFRRGSPGLARFAPDGQTVVYSASWDGEPLRIYSVRLGRPESSALALPDAELLAISSTGELAISLERRFVGSFISKGVLARVPLSGGAPREVLRDVECADWSPDGAELAIIHDVDGKNRLEFPIGTMLVESAGWMDQPRVSPAGDRLAFLDHPRRGDNGGSVAVVDRSGRKTVLSQGWGALDGLAWSPDGREIWVSGRRDRGDMLYAVSLDGKERALASGPGDLGLLDVSREGRALVAQSVFRIGTAVRLRGEARERDLSWLDWSLLRDFSDDGRAVLFQESGEGGGREYGIYLRSTDGAPAVRLGDGTAMALSADGAWALSAKDNRLSLLPTGPGHARPVAAGDVAVLGAAFVPGGARIVARGHKPGAGLRLWVLSLEGGEPRPITPEGLPLRTFAVTSDGRAVLALGPDARFRLYPLDAGEPHELGGLGPADWPIRFGRDGRSLYFYAREPPWAIRRLDLASGRQEKVYEIAATDRPGFLGIFGPLVTPDGKDLAYSYAEGLGTLYAVSGLR